MIVFLKTNLIDHYNALLKYTENLSEENEPKVFPSVSFYIHNRSILNCMINIFDYYNLNSYENIEAETRSFYTKFPEEQELLFEELKKFCNDKKEKKEQLSDEEIKNVLNLFLNNINNFEIKYHNKAKKQTFYHHIKSKEEAEQIYKNLTLIINQQTVENKIFTNAIKVRLNQLKQKYKITKNFM